MSEVVPMVLRGYREGDLEVMYALDVVCFERPFRFTRSSMRQFAEAKRALVVIAEEGETLVGFCILHVERTPEGKVGYVVTLDVEPEQRRKGIAAALMLEVERLGLEAGCRAIALHVYSGNRAAILFYERIGFVLSHMAIDFYGEGLNALVYHRLPMRTR